MKMISYKPFYDTLFKKGLTEYYLIFKQGFSANTLHRIKKGEAISTKTLDMPYNGADGYVMPITAPIDGEVELIIHAVRNDGGYGVLFLDNLKVSYYGEDNEEQKSNDSENRYARMTGLNCNDEEEISFMTISRKYNI